MTNYATDQLGKTLGLVIPKYLTSVPIKDKKGTSK